MAADHRIFGLLAWCNGKGKRLPVFANRGMVWILKVQLHLQLRIKVGSLAVMHGDQSLRVLDCAIGHCPRDFLGSYGVPGD